MVDDFLEALGAVKKMIPALRPTGVAVGEIQDLERVTPILDKVVAGDQWTILERLKEELVDLHATVTRPADVEPFITLCLDEDDAKRFLVVAWTLETPAGNQVAISYVILRRGENLFDLMLPRDKRKRNR